MLASCFFHESFPRDEAHSVIHTVKPFWFHHSSRGIYFRFVIWPQHLPLHSRTSRLRRLSLKRSTTAKHIALFLPQKNSMRGYGVD